MINQEKIKILAPGLLLCFIVGSIIFVMSRQVQNLLIDSLLLALIIGIVYKNVSPKSDWYNAGAKFAGKHILEFSVMILGASIFLPDILDAGLPLFLLILFGVVGSMIIAYIIGHLILGLNKKIATLIGVGNSICGNSAVAVMAPIIGASATDISAVIGISAVLGAAQIILLPLLFSSFGITEYHYGIVAGMAVYAVAQVYAASATVSATSATVATVVKITRIILLGPLVVVVQLIKSFASSNPKQESEENSGRFSLFNYFPWFVIGFIFFSVLRSVDVISADIGNQIRQLSKYLFVVSMVAIGLGVDIKDVLKVGPKVALTIICVIGFMITISLLIGSNISP